MSKTYRKIKTNAVKKPNTKRRFKKNKSSWQVFREEKNHLHSMKELTKHTGKVRA
ncbi:MAG: hypothetical protein HOL22_00360 [Euryarchaeota archaeon]|jgi:hypothetical protein|nr:hypothetical protein [Euryarchaeota archaeon]